jgi:hypothetical protein
VHPNWFLSLWYIWRKPCTYLLSRLTELSNGPKRASIWPTLPRSSIGYGQNDFLAHGIFRAYRASSCQVWHPLQANQSDLPLDPRHLGVPLGAPKMNSEPIACSTRIVHLSCVEISISQKRLKWASIWPTSSWRSIECSQNDSVPVVHSVQIVHLSDAEINTVTK